MFVKLILVDQKALNKHKTPGAVHAASKEHQVKTQEDFTKQRKLSEELAGTKRKLVEPSGQVTHRGEQTEPARKVTKEERQAEPSGSGRLEWLADVAAAQPKLLVKQTEPGGEEVMKEGESIKPGSEVDYDKLILRPVYETFQSFTNVANISKIAEVLCESYIHIPSSNTLVRNNTCPR